MPRRRMVLTQHPTTLLLATKTTTSTTAIAAATAAAEDPTQLRAQRRYGEVVNSPDLPTEERMQRTTNERKIFKFNITKFMHAET